MNDIAVRKLSRLGNELHLSSSIATAELVPGHFESAVVLILLLRRCGGDWIDGECFRRPQKIVQCASINALAASLHKPYATIHRHVMRLIDLGWVVSVDRGVAISINPGIEQQIIELMVFAHDSVVRLTEDLGRDMPFRSADRIPAPDLRWRIIAMALDIWLVPFEYAAEPVPDWTSKLVWIIIIVANVRHITIDPELTERYANNFTPDEVRRPITARAIARLSGLSYGTVYRHCQTLAKNDVIRYQREGWVLASRQIGSDQIDRGVRALLDYFKKRIVELVSYGFDPTNAATSYLDRRPEYVSLALSDLPENECGTGTS
ncbi:winged helix-turn-helix domain-containing protein [Glacieibacterium megasporae]|uniref:winged helix-turn-helix domain-containing protein n=1 Tax=Glacieibacterium megasporae TaxID=2835787 RepID=UPI001C1E14C3|nr:winged helix-turn-helix domain-containing protein [Polymorphobacter megasporae]UAJ08913.1 winged helix-turn-helix domain-containing protein [Polymorphobacter megasporae]